MIQSKRKNILINEKSLNGARAPLLFSLTCTYKLRFTYACSCSALLRVAFSYPSLGGQFPYMDHVTGLRDFGVSCMDEAVLNTWRRPCTIAMTEFRCASPGFCRDHVRQPSLDQRAQEKCVGIKMRISKSV